MDKCPSFKDFPELLWLIILLGANAWLQRILCRNERRVKNSLEAGLEFLEYEKNLSKTMFSESGLPEPLPI